MSNFFSQAAAGFSPSSFRRLHEEHKRIERGEGDTRVDRIIAGVMTADIVLSFMWVKVALPGDVNTILFIHAGAMAVLALLRKIYVDPVRLVTYLLFIGMCYFSSAYPDRFYKISSLSLVIVVYLWYIFRADVNWATYFRILNNFQHMMLVVCSLVFMDMAVQVVGLKMPSVEVFIPPTWLYHFFTYEQPLSWGSRFMKPNALFFLEASVLSQTLALALVIELVIFRRTWRTILYAASLVLTFAGTGWLMVIVSLPFFINRLKFKHIAFMAVLLPLLLVFAYQVGWVDIALKRQSEIGQRGSSVNGRFIVPYVESYQNFTSGSPDEQLFGLGAGGTGRTSNSAEASSILYNPITKVYLEYGPVVLLYFLVWFTFCNFSGGAPLVIAIVSSTSFYFLNGGFLGPLNVGFCYWFAGMYRVRSAKSTAAAAVAAEIETVSIAEPAMSIAAASSDIRKTGAGEDGFMAPPRAPGGFRLPEATIPYRRTGFDKFRNSEV